MSLSFCFWRFFQSSRLSSNYITGYIGIFKSSSISSMEISMVIGANWATENIPSFQRCGQKVLILSWRRQNAWLTSCNSSNFTNFHIFGFISNNISWFQRIDTSSGFKIDIGKISIIHTVISFVFSPVESMRSRSGSFDVMDVHYVTCGDVNLLLFGGSRAWNIIDVLLITDKFNGFSS